MIDKLRDLLLPAMALTILATLWAVARSRALEEDAARFVPPASHAALERAYHASAADDVRPVANPG